MTDTPHTPRALPTREQVTDAVGYVLRDSGNYPEAAQAAMVSRDISHLRDTIVDAVLALIDKENTMSDTHAGFCTPGCPDDCPGMTVTDDTIPVPRALIERVMSGSGEAVGALAALLDPPKPPTPRLRVVNLDDIRIKDIEDMGERFLSADDIEAQPDVLTVIWRVFNEWYDTNEIGDEFMDRIRAAFGVES